MGVFVSSMSGCAEFKVLLPKLCWVQYRVTLYRDILIVYCIRISSKQSFGVECIWLRFKGGALNTPLNLNVFVHRSFFSAPHWLTLFYAYVIFYKFIRTFLYQIFRLTNTSCLLASYIKRKIKNGANTTMCHFSKFFIANVRFHMESKVRVLCNLNFIIILNCINKLYRNSVSTFMDILWRHRWILAQTGTLELMLNIWSNIHHIFTLKHRRNLPVLWISIHPLFRYVIDKPGSRKYKTKSCIQRIKRKITKTFQIVPCIMPDIT